MTEYPARFLANAHALKVTALQDILRRVIANPKNVTHVAEELALDWMPMFTVDPKGKLEIVIGTGQKRQP